MQIHIIEEQDLEFLYFVANKIPLFSCAKHEQIKWFHFLGQVCGLSKMHRVYVHVAFGVSLWWKYAASGVRLSRAVWGRSLL